MLVLFHVNFSILVSIIFAFLISTFEMYSFYCSSQSPFELTAARPI